MDKQHLRQEIIEIRKNKSLIEKKRSSSIISKLLLEQQEVIHSKKICIYISTIDEVSTFSIVQRFLSNSIWVVVPSLKGGLKRIHSLNDLKLGKYNILEPKDDLEEIGIYSIDCFIIPGIAFDLHGNRLGRGKGYYDRLLEKVNTVKIGLAFSEQILPLLPHESYDIVMDVVISEKGVYEIKKN